MRQLSSYTGDEAIELWGDLIGPITRVFSDKKVVAILKDENKSKLEKVGEVVRLHKEDTAEAILRIDPTPINGLNIITRVLELLVEIENSEDLRPFFKFAGQAKTESESSGSAMANTGAGEN